MANIIQLLRAIPRAIKSNKKLKEMKTQYKQLIQENNFGGALNLLENFCKENPDDKQSAVMLTCFYMIVNQQVNAAQMMDRVLKSVDATSKDYIVCLYLFGDQDKAWEVAKQNNKTDDLIRTLSLMVGEDPTPEKFRQVMIGVEKMELEKAMSQQMKSE